MSVSPIIGSVQNMLELIETGSAARDQENEELRQKVVSLEKQLKKSKQIEMTYIKKFRTMKSSFHEVQKLNLKLKTHARKRKHDEIVSENSIENSSGKLKNEQPADKKLLMSD